MSAGAMDLNADMGEIPAALEDGTEELLLGIVTSANIACGGHAGSRTSMQKLVRLAMQRGVAIGAHPSEPDPANFGRAPVRTPPPVLEASIRAQVAALDAIVQAAGGSLRHIKPHGALYNEAARDAARAESIARALDPWRGRVRLVGLAGSVMLDVWRAAGFAVTAEAFADRAYEPDGRLRSRSEPNAVLTDPAQAAAQAAEIAIRRRAATVHGGWVPVEAESLCLHGDTPGAIAIATAVRSALLRAGVDLRTPA